MQNDIAIQGILRCLLRNILCGQINDKPLNSSFKFTLCMSQFLYSLRSSNSASKELVEYIAENQSYFTIANI